MIKRIGRDYINPYIALADVYMNLGIAFVLFALMFMLLGNRGWEDIRYKEEQKHMETVVRAHPALSMVELTSRNDAPGEQRWMFPSIVLFQGDSAQLTREGRRVLSTFAALLRERQELWWRIRVEAHSRQKFGRLAERQAFTLTANRAVEVAMFLKRCGIDPWRLVASGRGYQDPYLRDRPTRAENDRVDILLIPQSASRRGEVSSDGGTVPPVRRIDRN